MMVVMLCRVLLLVRWLWWLLSVLNVFRLSMMIDSGVFCCLVVVYLCLSCCIRVW